MEYQYSPQDGVGITLFFVNENGNYYPPTLLPLQKAFIRIGSTSFSMYPIRRKLSLSGGRRVMEVEFCDDLFRLSHYYLALTGRGCGQNVYTLGTPVDDRLLSVKLQTALDPIAQQIKEFTQFPDYVYTFNDFLAILRTKVNVVVQAQFDGTVKRDFVGTFRGVLEEWLALYNLSYFFENGQLKIFDPTKLTIILPTQSSLISDSILSFEDEEDVRNTYGKTVFNWYQEEGGEFPLNQTSTSGTNANQGGPLYVRTETLYPMGYEANLTQPTMPLDQVAAAQYGQPFWFLYNFVKGSTATYCAFTPSALTPDSQSASFYSTVQSVYQAANGNGRIAIFNEPVYNQNYEAYAQYGQSLAGRVYMSTEKSELAVDKGYTWFDESQGQITSFTNEDSRSININYLTPTSNGINIIPGTEINNAFPGFNYVGNRMAYTDTVSVNITGNFSLNGATNGLINATYQSIFTIPGNDSFDFNTQLASQYTGNNTFVAYNNGVTIPQDITDLINGIAGQTSLFNPRFTSIPIKGILQGDYSSLKASQSEPSTINVVNTNQGGNVIANTSVIKTVKQGNYTIYYDKYSKCASASSPDSYYGYEFQPNQISPDTQVDINFVKSANNAYQLTRNYGVIEAQVNNPYLPTMAQARTFSTKRVSFTINYFKSIPTDFLTHGLVGLSMSLDGAGVRASYTYSNEILEVAGRYREKRAEQQVADYAQRIKNSTLRHYEPTEVIS